MAQVLTTAATVTCGHGGTLTLVSSAKLTVGGKPVLLAGAIKGRDVTGCLTVDATDPPPAGTPKALHCRTVSAITSGLSRKLTVLGLPVVLDTLAGSTDGMVEHITPQTKLKATSAGQIKLFVTEAAP